ncbi:MAG: hypothetical protein WD005_02100, partial [Haliea sp.]
MSDGYRPRWMRDLERFLFLKPSFVLSGSVTDYQIVNVDGVLAPLAMVDALEQVLFRNGYGTVIAYDPAQGMRPVSDGGDELIQKLGLQLENGRARVGIPALTSAIERYNGLKEEQPIALIIDFAGRTIVRPESLDAAENGLFTQALVGGYRAMPTMHEARPFYNTVIWLVEKEGDLPDWLVVNN